MVAREIRATEQTRRVEDPLHDLRANPSLEREIPGLASVLDPRDMLPRLESVLVADSNQASIENCESKQAAYLPEARSCLVRYELDVRDAGGRPVAQPLVTVRAFDSQSAAASYFRDRLGSLVERARTLPGSEAAVRPAAVLEELNATVEVFPVDGELPTLVDAANPSRVERILGRVLAEASDNGFSVERCSVMPGHYGRQNRCVLRYEVDGYMARADQLRHLAVYGKVAVDDRGAAAADAIEALRDQFSTDPRVGFNVPNFAVFDPELRLLVLEVVPGTRRLSQLLRQRLRAKGREAGDEQELCSYVRAAAHTAAILHESGVTVGPVRTVGDELSELSVELEAVRALAPEFGVTLGRWLEAIDDKLSSTPAGEATFSHGDFSHTQLLFDDSRCGLVDFDTVCRAEPALDLGQFLAYLRLAVLKATKLPIPSSTKLAEDLCEEFLDSYVAASVRPGNVPHLRARVRGFEALSLLRLAIHSWRKFKPRRVEHAMTLLEERTSWLK